VQLRGFNMPYQLGYAPGMEDKFEKPYQGETLVVPVHDEDVVIVGTDGLFDNMEESDILEAVEEWDLGDITRRNAASAAAATHPSTPPAAEAVHLHALRLDGHGTGMQTLSERLAVQARAFSLDTMRDGPFARLAKDNDVLWTHGGRTDDITVVCGRVLLQPVGYPSGVPLLA